MALSSRARPAPPTWLATPTDNSALVYCTATVPPPIK
jgi:hypothetical protein